MAIVTKTRCYATVIMASQELAATRVHMTLLILPSLSLFSFDSSNSRRDVPHPIRSCVQLWCIHSDNHPHRSDMGSQEEVRELLGPDAPHEAASKPKAATGPRSIVTLVYPVITHKQTTQYKISLKTNNPSNRGSPSRYHDSWERSRPSRLQSRLGTELRPNCLLLKEKRKRRMATTRQCRAVLVLVVAVLVMTLFCGSSHSKPVDPDAKRNVTELIVSKGLFVRWLNQIHNQCSIAETPKTIPLQNTVFAFIYKLLLQV